MTNRTFLWIGNLGFAVQPWRSSDSLSVGESVCASSGGGWAGEVKSLAAGWVVLYTSFEAIGCLLYLKLRLPSPCQVWREFV